MPKWVATTCWGISVGHLPETASTPFRQSTNYSRKTSSLPNSAVKLSSVSDMSKSGTSNRMFILGMGYVGEFFARDLKDHGWAISGTCRTIPKEEELEQRGLDVQLFDANEPQWNNLRALRNCTHLLVCIPPVMYVGDQILQHEDFLKVTLMGGNLQWLCYLSSTSVYGDCKGAWVDEDYPPNPSSNLAKLRLDAEQGWLRLGAVLGLSTLVFRLGGIYGPGRSAVDTILEQVPLSEAKKRRLTKHYTSRIHVADVCQALRASTAVPVSRKIFNIVDDDPTSGAEVFAYAHKLIEKRWPGLVKQIDDPIISDAPENKYVPADEKRVLNSCMKMELKVRLLHPNYRSGLQAILDQIDSAPC